MLPVGVELSLLEWAQSKWTLFATRVAMLAVPVLFGIFVWIWGVVQTDASKEVAAVKASIATVEQVQAEGASDGEAFRDEVRRLVADLTVKVDGLGDDVFDTKVDVGVIRRLVTELRNQQGAAAARAPWVAPAVPPELVSLDQSAPLQ